MANGRDLLPKELLHQVEETARAQKRQPSELVAEAVRKYLEEQSWVQFVEKNENRARAKGIGEGDIERLISEVRRENAPCGH